MKILALESNPKERAVIQQVVEKGGHQFMQIETSEQAWRLIESDQSQFIIADWDTSDLDALQFIPRLRAKKPRKQVYILLLTTAGTDEEMGQTGADDYLRKPLSASELRARISIGEHILSLSSNLAQARDQLENTAVYDTLTNLLNQAAFHKQAAGELERARRGSAPFSMIALDIDNFKPINDQYGRESGDNVLRITAQVIRERSRPYDCIGHWEGDNFLLALAGVIGADAEKIAERVIKGVRSLRITVETGSPINVQLSAGIASTNNITASTELNSLIEKSQEAMRRAKEAGGNQVFLIYT